MPVKNVKLPTENNEANEFIIIDDSEEEKIQDVRLKYGKFLGKLK